MNTGGKARVGADLLGRAKTLDLADFRDDQERRVQADAVDVDQTFHLGKRLSHSLQALVEEGHLLCIMPKPFPQFVTDHALDRPEVLAAKPTQTARAERRPLGRFPILPRQQSSQLNLDFGQLSAEPGPASRQVAQLPVGFRRDVGQRNLLASQEIGQQLGVELVGLGAALYHGPQSHRMSQENGAVRTQQVVQPAIGSAGFDDRAKRSPRLHGACDRNGVRTRDGVEFMASPTSLPAASVA